MSKKQADHVSEKWVGGVRVPLMPTIETARPTQGSLLPLRYGKKGIPLRGATRKAGSTRIRIRNALVYSTWTAD